MTKFPCPDCGHKNDIDTENCEACGISFFVDGEDFSSTWLRAAAMSTEENKTKVRTWYDRHHPERLAEGEAMVTDDFKAYGLDPTAVNREDFQQVGAMFVAAFSDIEQTIEDQVAEADSEQGADRFPWWEQEPQISVSPWTKVRLVFRELLSTKVGMFLRALAEAAASTPFGPPGPGA